MANFKDSPKFEIHDDYYTPKWIFEKINHLIPKDKKIWEMCLLGSNEQSKKYLTELGHNVIGDNQCDCLTDTNYETECDMIFTNPPFQTDLKISILKKIARLDKPFMIIMNSCNVFSNYFQDIFKDKDIYFITPRGKFYYDKYNGQDLLIDNQKNKSTSFYSVIVCYKTITKNHFV
jgi:hypothetical protein